MSKHNDIPKSAVYLFVQQLYRNEGTAFPHSWRTLNPALRATLSLAITTGFRFAPNDFATIYNDFDGDYWFGELRENLYAEACTSGNLSACKSFENWINRRPYMWKGKRLFVGALLDFGSVRGATVTSFSSDDKTITACTHKPYESGKPSRIDKRVTITREELKTGELSNKEVRKALQAVRSLTKALRIAGVYGITTQDVESWNPGQKLFARRWVEKHEKNYNEPHLSFFPKSYY
ncbi:MAG: hypothetical protein WC683_17350 [bacterium]